MNINSLETLRDISFYSATAGVSYLLSKRSLDGFLIFGATVLTSTWIDLPTKIFKTDEAIKNHISNYFFKKDFENTPKLFQSAIKISFIALAVIIGSFTLKNTFLNLNSNIANHFLTSITSYIFSHLAMQNIYYLSPLKDDKYLNIHAILANVTVIPTLMVFSNPVAAAFISFSSTYICCKLSEIFFNKVKNEKSFA